MIRTRQVHPEDHATFVAWGKFWKFAYPPLEILPNRGAGGLVVCDDDGTMICAGYVYMSNSTIAWSEFIISNPAVKSKIIRTAALNQLIQDICQVSKDEGYDMIITSVVNKNLVERYKKNGFVVGSTGAFEMIKKL